MDFLKPRVGRGLASADFDNDGLPDLALSGVGESTALLRNRSATENGWLSLELVGDGRLSNRNAIGATVTANVAGKSRVFFVVGGGSYLSASDRRLLIGLGTSPRVDHLSVKWPSGKTQEFRDLPARNALATPGRPAKPRSDHTTRKVTAVSKSPSPARRELFPVV